MFRIIKWLSRLFLCGLIIWALSGVLTFWLNKPATPPSVKDAPIGIQTYSNDEFRIPSRIYYAAKIELLDSGTPQITTFWTYDGVRFHKHSGTKDFPYAEYGDIDIWLRTQ